MIEFNAGDTVTYMPYDEAYQMKIIKASLHNSWNEIDGKVYYHLSESGTGTATTVTTGHSIHESEYFVPFTGDWL